MSTKVKSKPMIKTSSDENEQQQQKRPPEKKKRTKKVSVKERPPLKKPIKAAGEQIGLEEAIEDQKPATATGFRERGGKPVMVPFPLPENFESQQPPASSAKADIVINDEVDTGEAEAEKKDLLNVGDVIGGYLKITSKVSEGGFGEVYTALDTNKDLTVAIKAENNVDSTLLEMRVLTKFQTHTNCPKVFEAGKTRTFSYIAMQLLGKNLSQIRRSCPYVPQRLSLATTYGVLVQCLHAMEGLHDTGYIHRDIKPSNFAVGCQPEDKYVVYLFDFGLCRRYTNDDCSIKAPRPYVGFRGTVRYASLAAHEGRELSRQDDLISLFYSFIELISGNLPWRSVTEKTAVADLKRSFNFDSFCHLMPDEIDRFVKIILDVRFADRPPYDRMVQLFRRLMMRSAGGIQDENSIDYEWINRDCRHMEHWRPSISNSNIKTE